MIRVIVLIGTRPEAIKMAPVIRELRARPEKFHCCVVSSGQHREMVAQALNTFRIEVDVQCDAMSSAKSLGSLTARLFQDLDHVYESEKPDWVLVQGDTNTAMAGALCAFYRRINVGHIEAGLRTFDRLSPFPEEVNRSIIGQVADLHFAPTQRSVNNLLKAGIADKSVVLTGNTVVDALQWIQSVMPEKMPSSFSSIAPEMLSGRKIILVTAHRRESFGDGLIRICDSLLQITDIHRECVIVFPVHLNPRVREVVFSRLAGHSRILLTDPLEYLELLWLIRAATVILTDSGGIQEEAPSFSKPVVILRETTERPEVVEAGFGRLVGTDVGAIVKATSSSLRDGGWNSSITQLKSPFGDGTAARQIVDRLAGCT
jgi:UDP-N-acetylglucosamine 2-epimerase (non-hydrolysing)